MGGCRRAGETLDPQSGSTPPFALDWAVRTLALILTMLIAAASIGDALVVSEFPIASDRERVERQRRGGRGFRIRAATPEDFDGLYQFCRVAFNGNRAGDGGGWGVDYPSRRHQPVDPVVGADQDARSALPRRASRITWSCG